MFRAQPTHVSDNLNARAGNGYCGDIDVSRYIPNLFETYHPSSFNDSFPCTLFAY